MEHGIRQEPTKALEALLLRSSKRNLLASRAAIIRELQRRAKRDQVEVVTRCPQCRITVLRSSDNLTGHCNGCSMRIAA